MNPWLALPLGDYEGHMGSPDVDQLVPLSDLFSDVLRRHRPASVAILGIAGGNGLEHVDQSVTGRVVGLDLNPHYAGTGLCLDNAPSLVAPGGVLSTVLQVPSETAGAVGTTPFPSMETLASHFAFVDPDHLQQALAERGWTLVHQSRLPLPSGKAFWSGGFVSTDSMRAPRG